MVKHPIRQIGVRVAQWMGADRELAMFTCMLTVVLVFVTFDWMGFFFGAFAWFFCIWGLRRMAKADPMMRQVYLRSLRYGKYYPPRGTPFVKNDNVKE